MILKHLVTGPLQVNTYIVGDEATGDAVVIDPGGEAEEIMQVAQKAGLQLRRIINTHAHFDHVGGVNDLKAALGIPFCLHPADLPVLENFTAVLQDFGLAGGPPPTVDEYLEEGQIIAVGQLRLRVLYTPGHSPGHVTFVHDDSTVGPDHPLAFSGDVLFQGSIGRYDLPGASYEQLMHSIREKLIPLGDNTVVYPGHGPSTTIGEEKRYNPFLREIRL